MRLIKRFQNLYLRLRAAVPSSSFFSQMINFFSPWRRYEQELAELLAPREDAYQLYLSLLRGKNAKDLYEEVLQISESEDPKESLAAWAILSYLYQEDVNNQHLSIPKNEEQAASFANKAAIYLGPKCPLTSRMSKYLDAIRMGGESHYALRELQDKAKRNQQPMGSWSSKVLSYVYRNGVQTAHIQIAPDKQLAKEYQQRCILGMDWFNEKLNTLVDTLKKTWFARKKAFNIIKKIADTGNQHACYEYGHYLEKAKRDAKGAVAYYKKAADRKNETCLNLKNSGNPNVKKYLVKAFEQKRLILSPELIQEYQFDLASNFNDVESEAYILSRQRKDRDKETTSILFLAIPYYFKKGMLDEAETDLSFLLTNRDLFTDQEQQRIDHFCLALADYYKDLFVESPSSVLQASSNSLVYKLDGDAQNALEKAVFYYRCIRPTSPEYSAVSYEVAHLEKYFLDNQASANAILKKRSQIGDSYSTFLAVSSEFREYWCQEKCKLSKEQQELIAHYEKINVPVPHRVRPAFSDNIYQDTPALIHTLLSELEQYEKGAEQQAAESLSEIKELQVSLAKFQDMMQAVNSMKMNVRSVLEDVSVFTSSLEKKFPHLSNNYQTKKNNLSFFKSPCVEQYRTLLQSYLELLTYIKTTTNNNSSSDSTYLQLVRTACCKYVAVACRKLFEQDEKLSTLSADCLPTKPRVMGYV